MKFKTLKMNNFMRYKGENVIEFSCDPEKNVTVVLGDNTVGKTTIAQAFRWGLYGTILAERGKRQEDYQFLNYDILELMDANSRADVSVEIVVADEEKQYDILRVVEYTRAFPKLEARESVKKLSMQISDISSPQDTVKVEENQVQDVINELFPKTLSHYFLFDGERWNDVTVNGVRENIKDSVHVLTGLSAYRAAMDHLKDMGSNSVVKTFRGNIKGSGHVYDHLEKERNQMEREIEKCKNQIDILNINVKNYQEKCAGIEEYLETNRNTEEMQTKYRQLQVVQKTQREKSLTNYKMLVNEYSDKAYMLFAKPMIDAALELVRSVAGERRDIPHMRQASIDHIIKSGTCICGTKIRPATKEFEALMEQRNYLPPADIGSLLGEFERTGNRWRNRSRESGEELQDMAGKVDESIEEYEQTCYEIKRLEKSMDHQIDFAEQRHKLKNYRMELQRLSLEKGEVQGRMESCRRRIEHIENEMKSQEAQGKENEKWRSRLDIAEQLYHRLRQDFEEKEKKTFVELNGQVQQNFEQMFNAKDKKIQLTPQYEIEMMYQTDIGYREEKNLSEGEKIARNFAFVVSIMDYSRKKKAERNGQESDTLPLVLDGPFSKLGHENIRLIAQVLPKTSEQVILFMLDKDWKYTGLDPYVGASYQIVKSAKKAYAFIQRSEVVSNAKL